MEESDVVALILLSNLIPPTSGVIIDVYYFFAPTGENKRVQQHGVW